MLYILYTLMVSAFLIEFLIIYLFKRKRKTVEKGFKNLIKFFFTHIFHRIRMIFVILGVFLGFMIYQNEISPSTLNTYYLTNGEKEIVFQEMAHVAIPDFYVNIKDNIKLHEEKGFVLYWEGLLREDEQDDELLKQCLGFVPNEKTYGLLEKLTGNLEVQNNQELISGVKNKRLDVSVKNLVKNTKINTDEILGDINNTGSLINTGLVNNTGSLVNTGIVNNTGSLINTGLVNNTGSLVDIEKTKSSDKTFGDYIQEVLSKPIDDSLIEKIGKNYLIKYLYLAEMNFVVKNEWFRNMVTKLLGAKGDCISNRAINYRNDFIIDMLDKTKDSKIFVTYGAGHFNGVFDGLKKKDDRWGIKKTEKSIIFK